MIKIIIVDDHQMIIDGLSVLLPTEFKCKIVGTFSSGEAVVEGVNNIKCDVILMDIMMPGAYSGIQATKIIKEKHPDIKIIGLSMLGDATTINAMLTYGADGYLPKNASGKEIKDAIITVNEGKKYIHKELLQFFIEGTIDNHINKIHILTSMESQILQLIIKGLTTKDISEVLFRSEETIKSHRKNLLKKYKCKNVAELVAYALRNHIVQ